MSHRRANIQIEQQQQQYQRNEIALPNISSLKPHKNTQLEKSMAGSPVMAALVNSERARAVSMATRQQSHWPIMDRSTGGLELRRCSIHFTHVVFFLFFLEPYSAIMPQQQRYHLDGRIIFVASPV